MKKLLLLLAVLFCLGTTYAQNEKSEKFVEVTGKAVKEITPDQIFLNISIHEYHKNDYYDRENYDPNKKREKVSLSEVETELISALRKLGVSRDAIKTERNTRRWSGPSGNLLRSNYKAKQSRSLSVKVNSFKTVDAIFNDIKIRGISSITIGRLASSKAKNYEDQLNAEALENAKVRARKLVEGLDKKLGEVLSIVELGGYYRVNNYLTDKYHPTGNDKIKISSQLKVRFGIK